jgi:aminoglycoside 3-N-acetyltransferase I
MQHACPSESRVGIVRLTVEDVEQARALFITMARVFESECEPLSDAYLRQLLRRDDFWVLAAVVDGQTVGGVTAFTLPLTRVEESEIFVYDLAVLPEFHRRGVGRKLIATLRSLALSAEVADLFVAADNEDTDALDFYRAIGGSATPVTIFTFRGGRG